MKYLFTLIAIMGYSVVASAQSNISPRKNNEEKKFLDSLQKTFGQPVIQIVPQLLLVYNTPVVPMKNEGEKVDMSGEDTVYRMKKDNMGILKPNAKTTYIPNAADGRMFIVPPATKQP